MELTPLDEIESFLLAAAGVGTASMGVVELGKGNRWFATLGAWPIRQFVKENLGALQYTWGPTAPAEEVALDAWRLGEEKLRETLETGILLAVNAEEEEVVEGLAARFGVPRDDLLRVAPARRPRRDPAPDTPPDPAAEEDDRAIERANSIFDLRVRSAVARAVAKACAQQKAWFQALAAALSLGLCLFAARNMNPVQQQQAALIGLLAVPLAPIAKNFVSLLQSARSALAARAA